MSQMKYIPYPDLSSSDKALVDAFLTRDKGRLNHDKIELALKTGANPNINFDDDDVTSNGQITPLCYSIFANDKPLYDLLLDYGADIFGLNITSSEHRPASNLEVMLHTIGSFYGADESYLRKVLARITIGAADPAAVRQTLESIDSDVRKLCQVSDVDSHRRAREHILRSFETLREMGATFGGSVPGQAVANVPAQPPAAEGLQETQLKGVLDAAPAPARGKPGN